jgi:hypothetical protein
MSTKFTLSISLLFVTLSASFAQDSSRTQVYTGFYNQLSGDIHYPVLGLVNVIDGTQQKGMQLGLTNYNTQYFTGFQLGLTNIVGKSAKGAQLGFVSLCKDSFAGVQISYININGKHQEGVQVAFLNLSQSNASSIQIGTVNVTTTNTEGVQIGYVNLTGKELEGAQVGFVNVTGQKLVGSQVGFINAIGQTTTGTQIGFVNASKAINGMQLGFVNIADSFASGVPIGFLSIVKKGGYYALELSSNELYYYNAAFKIGVKPLHTSFGLSYNPNYQNAFAFTVGLGSIINLKHSFFINPELNNIGTIEKRPQFFTQLSTSFGRNFGPVAFKLGPTFTWNYVDKTEYRSDIPKQNQPSKSLYQNQLDSRNNFFIGAKASIVFSFE